MSLVVRDGRDFDNKTKQKFVRGNFPLNDKQEDDDTSDHDTKCGILSCTPAWLQVFTSKKSYVVAYTLVLTMLYTINAYFVGTISTVEKNYKMSSKMLGSIKGTAEIGSLIFNFILTYFVGKGHKGKWLAIGMIIAGLSAFLRILPYVIYGAGGNVRMYTEEYVHERNFTMYTSASETEDTCDEYMQEDLARNFAFKIFLVAQITLEVAGILLKTAGAVYLDDNTRKNIFPFLFTIIHALRSIGVTMGFMLASYTLEVYVDPTLTPNIDKQNPRWIGAWWLGWIPISVACFILAAFLILFPRTLPRAALRNKQLESQPSNSSPSTKDFIESTKRILKNKMVLLDSLSAVCFKIGLAAYEMFLPKYIDSQFGLSPSRSNFSLGVAALIGKPFGIVMVGWLMTSFKPTPRTLMASNVMVGILSVLMLSSYSFINCSRQQIQGHWNSDHSWNLTEPCNINECENIKYSPVCYNEDKTLYFSACHAGCSLFANHSKVYEHCTCAPHLNSVVDGSCPLDCSTYVITFFVILGIFRLIRTSIKSTKKIIRFRYVSEADKSLSLGINKVLLSIFAAFPSPILYGFILDWTCIIFEETCGKTGNCWLHDVEKLRYTFNLTACGFLTLGTILDCFLWYHVKHLKLYDEDFHKEKKTSEMEKIPENETMLK